ncbi:MAG: hypothetical protein ACT4O1_18090 [Gemmatimonadota bacterium]
MRQKTEPRTVHQKAAASPKDAGLIAKNRRSAQEGEVLGRVNDLGVQYKKSREGFELEFAVPRVQFVSYLAVLCENRRGNDKGDATSVPSF